MFVLNMSSLSNLTEEIIHTAFDKTLIENEVIQGKVILVGGQHYAKVFEFLRNELYKTEYVCQELDVRWSHQLEDMYRALLDQRISLMLLDNNSGDVIGIRLMAITKRDDDLREDQFDDLPMKQMVGFWRFCDSRANFFDHYKINEAAYFFGLGVDVRYRNKGIATMLVDFALKFLKNLPLSAIYVKVGVTSALSARIFEKFGFELVAEVKYEDYKRDDRVVIRSTESNYSRKTYGLIV